MTYHVVVSDDTDKILRKWKKSNPQLLKKFQKIYHELADHPREGLGHPEPLKGGDGITFSRRVTAQHRMIYDIHEDIVQVHVLSVEGHYGDK